MNEMPAHVEVAPSGNRTPQFCFCTYMFIPSYSWKPSIKDTHSLSHTHTLFSELFWCKQRYNAVLHRHNVLTVSHINRSELVVQLRCDSQGVCHFRQLYSQKEYNCVVKSWMVFISQCFNYGSIFDYVSKCGSECLPEWAVKWQKL